MSDIYRALARTALLIDLDIVGPGMDHYRIVDGLRATTARIIADRTNVGSPAGQTALVTLYAQLAMLGLQIDLDVPAAGLLTDQPPLHSGDLLSSLLDYSADLLPGGSAQPSATPDVTFALGDTPGPAELGDVDIISGGAITNSALYTLLRIPAVTAAVRVIEPDLLDLPNLNRYALARRSTVGWQKTHALTSFQTPSIRITGTDETFSEATSPGFAPMAPRLLVGVDHIPSRWAAQDAAASRWVCVGSSSHDFVLVSAHPADSACAGCVHTHDDDITGDIPTISFVSFWAGLIQALELIARAAGRSPAWTRTTYVWPFGLDNPRGVHQFTQHPVTGCPVGCLASAALPAA